MLKTSTCRKYSSQRSDLLMCVIYTVVICCVQSSCLGVLYDKHVNKLYVNHDFKFPLLCMQKLINPEILFRSLEITLSFPRRCPVLSPQLADVWIWVNEFKTPHKEKETTNVSFYGLLWITGCGAQTSSQGSVELDWPSHITHKNLFSALKMFS